MFASGNLCRDNPLITPLSQQWLRRLPNEVSEGNKSSSDEVFVTIRATQEKNEAVVITILLITSCKHFTNINNILIYL